ncbi:integral membrane protein [Fusarium circinatum]|uniref:Integral membrane protein n=1 Tax=Fusarium circinatum TaxID=48490 RepID=A0A8H5WGA5_FUSCI|nr:integral membrane protein [Fusarium circinatum]
MPSLAPTIFLWKLKRPRKEKILGAIMGMGKFASVASLVKATLVKESGMAKDAWALTNSIATWTALEQNPHHDRILRTISQAPRSERFEQNGLDAIRKISRQSRMLNKSAVNSRRDIYGGYEDPFASGDSNDAIPLEGKVYEVDISGPLVNFDYNNEAAGNVTLNHGIFLGETIKLKAKVKDVMHIKKGLLCYEYEDTY